MILLWFILQVVTGTQLSKACYASDNQQHKHPKIFLGVINDSFIGSLERGEKGQYLGPDDFFTASFFYHMHYENWRVAITYNDVTSRKYNYRYDLVYSSLSRSYSYREFKIQPGFGLVWRDDFGGDEVQNWFHRLRGLPVVELPYLGRGLGIIGSAIGSWETEVSYLGYGLFTTALELRLVSDLYPSRISPMLSYQTELWNARLQIEVLGGARFYLNQVEHYSEFVRSGVFWGGNLKTRIVENLYFDLGIAFFPAQNLENDPLYANKEFNYIPQIISTVSWNSAWYRFYNFLEY